MKKQRIVFLIVLLVIILSGAIVCWYLINSREEKLVNTTLKVLNNAAKISSSATNNVTSTSANFVTRTENTGDGVDGVDCPDTFKDFSVLKVDDCYAGMSVKKIDIGDTKEEGSVLFVPWIAASIQVEGKYIYYKKNEPFIGGLVFFYPDKTTILPEIEGAKGPAGFYFSNESEAYKEFGPIGSSGTATVSIKNYFFIRIGAEALNHAELDTVISKTGNATSSEAIK